MMLVPTSASSSPSHSRRRSSPSQLRKKKTTRGAISTQTVTTRLRTAAHSGTSPNVSNVELAEPGTTAATTVELPGTSLEIVPRVAKVEAAVTGIGAVAVEAEEEGAANKEGVNGTIRRLPRLTMGKLPLYKEAMVASSRKSMESLDASTGALRSLNPTAQARGWSGNSMRSLPGQRSP